MVILASTAVIGLRWSYILVPAKQICVNHWTKGLPKGRNRSLSAWDPGVRNGCPLWWQALVWGLDAHALKGRWLEDWMPVTGRDTGMKIECLWLGGTVVWEQDDHDCGGWWREDWMPYDCEQHWCEDSMPWDLNVRSQNCGKAPLSQTTLGQSSFRERQYLLARLSLSYWLFFFLQPKVVLIHTQ